MCDPLLCEKDITCNLDECSVDVDGSISAIIGLSPFYLIFNSCNRIFILIFTGWCKNVEILRINKNVYGGANVFHHTGTVCDLNDIKVAGSCLSLYVVVIIGAVLVLLAILAIGTFIYRRRKVKVSEHCTYQAGILL